MPTVKPGLVIPFDRLTKKIAISKNPESLIQWSEEGGKVSLHFSFVLELQDAEVHHQEFQTDDPGDDKLYVKFTDPSDKRIVPNLAHQLTFNVREDPQEPALLNLIIKSEPPKTKWGLF